MRRTYLQQKQNVQNASMEKLIFGLYRQEQVTSLKHDSTVAQSASIRGENTLERTRPGSNRVYR